MSTTEDTQTSSSPPVNAVIEDPPVGVVKTTKEDDITSKASAAPELTVRVVTINHEKG